MKKKKKKSKKKKNLTIQKIEKKKKNLEKNGKNKRKKNFFSDKVRACTAQLQISGDDLTRQRHQQVEVADW
jgi:hypothetical protein